MNEIPPASLTYAQVVRLHRAAVKRFKSTGGIQSIAFGCARRDGKLDESRGFSICFHVKRKSKRPPSGERFPKEVVLRLRASKGLRRVNIPTDVSTFLRPSFTGRSVLVDAGSSWRTASAGLTITWRQSLTGQPVAINRLAFLTVGHTFKGVSAGSVVRLAGGSGQYDVFGQLLGRTNPSSNRDAALVEVGWGAVQFLGAVISSAAKIAARDEVLAAIQTKGFIAAPNGAKSIRYVAVHPRYPGINSLGTIADVVEAESTVQNTFGEGTSGSAWLISSHASCVQTAAVNNTGYRTGLGQMIVPLLDWAIPFVQSLPGTSPGSIKLGGIY